MDLQEKEVFPENPDFQVLLERRLPFQQEFY